MKNLKKLFFYGPTSIASITIFFGFTILGFKEFFEKGMTLDRFYQVFFGTLLTSSILWFIGFIMESDKHEYSKNLEDLKEKLNKKDVP